jgi:hypothetical protein
MWRELKFIEADSSAQDGGVGKGQTGELRRYGSAV